MNSHKSLKDIHLSWSDLMSLYQRVGSIKEYAIANTPRENPPLPGIYNQSSVSELVDEYRGIKTMGPNYYTKPSFEIKVI